MNRSKRMPKELQAGVAMLRQAKTAINPKGFALAPRPKRDTVRGLQEEVRNALDSAEIKQRMGGMNPRIKELLARPGLERLSDWASIGPVQRAALEDFVELILMEGSAWSSGLQCRWISWAVVDDNVLRLDMPDANCCDMRGAIKAAGALCPMVWRIDTYAGGKPDTTYWIRKGKWISTKEVKA